MGLFARHVAARAEVEPEPSPAKPKNYTNTTPTRVDATTPATLGRVALCLIEGYTITKIAHSLGVSVPTARRWVNHPDVQAEMKAAFAERKSAVMRALDGSSLEAITFLRETLNDPVLPTKERIRAAVQLLDRGGVPRGMRIDVHTPVTGVTSDALDVSKLTDKEVEAAALVILARRGLV